MKRLEETMELLKDKICVLNDFIEEDLAEEAKIVLVEVNAIAETISYIYEDVKLYVKKNNGKYEIKIFSVIPEIIENMFKKYSYTYTHSDVCVEDFVKRNNGEIVTSRQMKPNNLLNAPYYNDVEEYTVTKDGKVVYLYVFDGEEELNIIRTEQPATYAEVLKMIDEIFEEE